MVAASRDDDDFDELDPPLVARAECLGTTDINDDEVDDESEESESEDSGSGSGGKCVAMDRGLLQNCPVTPIDARRACFIFGPDLAALTYHRRACFIFGPDLAALTYHPLPPRVRLIVVLLRDP